jgi:hypothetical protein
LPDGIFKFFRTRPSNFPSLRIAQWIQILTSDNFFDKVISMNEANEFSRLIYKPLVGFWAENFSFTAPSNGFSTQVGKDFANLLFINAIAPFLLFYGKKTGQFEYEQKPIDWLENLKGENNKIIQKYRNLGFPTNSAGKTQALLWLKNKYCDQRKCLQCSFGAQIFKGDSL